MAAISKNLLYILNSNWMLRTQTLAKLCHFYIFCTKNEKKAKKSKQRILFWFFEHFLVLRACNNIDLYTFKFQMS